MRLVFDFENYRRDQGAFAVTGDFDKHTGEIMLKPQKWVNSLGGMEVSERGKERGKERARERTSERSEPPA